MERRQFLRSAAATGAGWLILPSGTLRGANAPSNRLEYDGATGRVTNSAEGNDLPRRKYREGWALNG